MPKTPILTALAPVLGAVAIAACGSGAKSAASTPPPAATGASSAAAAPASSAPAAGGGYGYSPASSATPSAAPATTALITTKHTRLGTVLAFGSKKLTVYLFEADRDGKSTCTGSCAQVWPPVLGKPKASGDASSGDLGTITRSDGTVQVTYRGHPLYRFIKDRDAGDAYGEAIRSFGAEWYALRPSGEKLDNS